MSKRFFGTNSRSPANSDELGAELFELTAAYARLGDHRSGTAVDRATRSWLAGELRVRGAAALEAAEYDFPRYVAEAELEVEGRRLECLPLFYSAAGSLEARRVAIARLPMRGGLVPLDLASALGGLPPAEAAVLATDGPGGRLVAINRDPNERGALPVVLAAGRDHAVLAAGAIALRFRARIEAAASASVVAGFGDVDAEPFVVTTPLTGWFACAGERGTGIAVALEVARRLARDHAVLFVGTTGHELEHLGLRAFLRARRELRPRAVLQLGASLGAGDRAADGTLSLSAMRFAMASGVEDRAGLAAALAPALLPLAEPGEWPGEGREWRSLGVPLVSITGGFSAFHSRDDVTERVTSPALLAVVCQAVYEAALRLGGEVP